MHRYVYRELEAHQTALLGSVDRSEAIDGLYRCVGGVLRLEPVEQEATGWGGAGGGRALGAGDDGQLVGVAALDVTPVGGALETMTLDMLYVSAAHRARG